MQTGKPDALSNCSISNQTFDMFHVSCSEGFDGGLSQEFVAEVYLLGHKNLFGYVNSKLERALSQNSDSSLKCLINFLPRTPFFELKGLEPGMNYDVVVMAVNKKGKSNPVLIQGYTVKNPEKQTGNPSAKISFSSSCCWLSLSLSQLLSHFQTSHQPLLRHFFKSNHFSARCWGSLVLSCWYYQQLF